MTTSVNQNETPLPRAVRAQMDRVNARIEARAATPTPQPSQIAAAGGDGGTPSAENPDGASSTPVPTPSPTPQDGDPRENDPAYWKQRFQVTQGMLRSAQERQASSIADKDQQIAELRDKVRSLEVNREPDKIDVSAYFSPEQIERFGQEQCEAMARTALKAAGQEAQRMIDAEIKPIRERSKAQAQEVEQAKEDAFWEALTEAKPNWQDINALPTWLEWLRGADESTGLQRQSILDQHRSTRNVPGLVRMFNNFEKNLKRPEPPVAPRSSAGTDGATAADAGANSARGYPTREEIRDFYKRSATGRVKDAERVEFEARLRSKAAA